MIVYMTHYITAFLVSVPVFFAIDMIWLGLIAKNFYQGRLSHLLAAQVNWPVAISFYLIFLVGVTIFVTIPALEARDITKAILFGALFGFFTYATYDLTNWATLKDWPWQVAVVDMVWGAVLSASVATVTYFILSRYIIG